MPENNLNFNKQEGAYGAGRSSNPVSGMPQAPGAIRKPVPRMSDDAIARLNQAPLQANPTPNFLEQDSLEKAQGRGRALKKTTDVIKEVTAKAIGTPVGMGARKAGELLGDSTPSKKTGPQRLWLIMAGIAGFGLMAVKSGVELITNLFSKKVPSLFKAVEFGAFAIMARHLYKTITGGEGFSTMTGLSGLSALSFMPWLMNKAYDGKVKAINHLDKLNNGETTGMIKSFMDVLSSPIKAILGIKKEAFKGNMH